MKVTDVYEGYFAAEGTFNGVKRGGAKTALTAENGAKIFWDSPIAPERFG